MKYNIPEVHHHHSLRLQGYDYSGEGLYFITIYTKDRQNSFGKISKEEMILDEIGNTAEMMLEEVSKHFGHTMVAEHVVMPNHVHLIFVLKDIRKFVGDGEMMVDGIRLDVGPCHGMALRATDDGIVGTCHGMSPPHGVSPPVNLFGKPIVGSVSVIINQYKASVKRWCNKNGHEYFHWQSCFYDHIIRNEEYYNNIVNYMRDNPKLWENDKFYLKQVTISLFSIVSDII